MRRRRRDNSPLISFRLLLLLIIVLQIWLLPSLAAAGSVEIKGRWSPARKMRFLNRRKGESRSGTTPYGELGKSSSNYYNGSINEEDEKRLVHTGPNPLHN